MTHLHPSLQHPSAVLALITQAPSAGLTPLGGVSQKLVQPRPVAFLHTSPRPTIPVQGACGPQLLDGEPGSSQLCPGAPRLPPYSPVPKPGTEKSVFYHLGSAGWAPVFLW